MRSTSTSPGLAATLCLALGMAASCVTFAAARPAAPAELPELPDSSGPEPTPYAIDFVALGDTVTGDLRRRLDAFSDHVKDDALHYTKLVIDRDKRRAIHLSIDATRASAGQETTVYRVQRQVFLAQSPVDADELMASARSRHGGSPRCQAVQRGDPPGKGMALVLEGFDRGGLLDLPSDWRTRAAEGKTADACFWGGVRVVARGQIACDSACLSALVVHPVPGAQLMRLDELAYDPALDPARHH